MKKKTTIIPSCIIFLFACGSSQPSGNEKYFEGKITYNISYITKSEKADTVFLNKIWPTQAEMYYKEGNYFETFKGSIIREEIYNKQDNKDYTMENSDDTLYWSDCSKEGEPIKKSRISSKKKNILGIDCDELTIFSRKKNYQVLF